MVDSMVAGGSEGCTQSGGADAAVAARTCSLPTLRGGVGEGEVDALTLGQLYPLPWHREVYDARIIIVAANYRRVAEIEPGQHSGRIPSRAECIALADLIVETVNG